MNKYAVILLLALFFPAPVLAGGTVDRATYRLGSKPKQGIGIELHIRHFKKSETLWWHLDTRTVVSSNSATPLQANIANIYVTVERPSHKPRHLSYFGAGPDGRHPNQVRISTANGSRITEAEVYVSAEPPAVQDSASKSNHNNLKGWVIVLALAAIGLLFWFLFTGRYRTER